MKRKLFLCILLISLVFTGCAKEHSLTEEQTDITAEYLAGVLLKYDKNYSSGFLTIEYLEKDKEKPADKVEPDEADEDDWDIEDPDEGGEITDAKSYAIQDVIAVKGFKIEYESYELYDYYPKDGTDEYFTLSPPKDKQLLVASFIVENTTDKKRRLDLKRADVKYQLDINKGSNYRPSLTLLENDLRYIDLVINPGEPRTVLLIFEIPKNQTIQSVTLNISKEDKSKLIELY